MARFMESTVYHEMSIAATEGAWRKGLCAMHRKAAHLDMAPGGAAEETELTPREREICATIGPELKRRGLLFVGVDVIDGYLTEINVTSPTGIRAIKRLGGADLAVAIWDAIEAKRAAR